MACTTSCVKKSVVREDRQPLKNGVGKTPRTKPQFRPTKEGEKIKRKAHQFCPGTRALMEIQKFQKSIGITHSKEAILLGGERDITGREVLVENPSISHYGPTRSGRSISGQVIGGWAHWCHPCKANHTHAKRYLSGKTNNGGKQWAEKKERLLIEKCSISGCSVVLI